MQHGERQKKSKLPELRVQYKISGPSVAAAKGDVNGVFGVETNDPARTAMTYSRESAGFGRSCVKMRVRTIWTLRTYRSRLSELRFLSLEIMSPCSYVTSLLRSIDLDRSCNELRFQMIQYSYFNPCILVFFVSGPGRILLPFDFPAAR